MKHVLGYNSTYSYLVYLFFSHFIHDKANLTFLGIRKLVKKKKKIGGKKKRQTIKKKKKKMTIITIIIIKFISIL